MEEIQIERYFTLQWNNSEFLHWLRQEGTGASPAAPWSPDKVFIIMFTAAADMFTGKSITDNCGARISAHLATVATDTSLLRHC